MRSLRNNKTAAAHLRTTATPNIMSLDSFAAAAADCLEDEQEDNCTDDGHNDLSEKTICVDSKKTEDESADERTDATDEHIADKTEARVLYEHVGNPAGNETNEKKPDNFHKYVGEGIPM
jgi:hypothetical protein